MHRYHVCLIKYRFLAYNMADTVYDRVRRRVYGRLGVGVSHESPRKDKPCPWCGGEVGGADGAANITLHVDTRLGDHGSSMRVEGREC